MNRVDNRQELITENIGLAYWAAHKYKNRSIEFEDLKSIALLGLVKAAGKYEPSKGAGFSTFALKVISTEIFYEMRKCKRRPETVSLDAEIVYSNTGEGVPLLELLPCEEKGFERAEAAAVAPLLFRCGLKEKERKAIYLTVCQEMKQCEAGERLRMAQSHVSRCVKSGLRKMRLCLEEGEEKLCR